MIKDKIVYFTGRGSKYHLNTSCNAIKGKKIKEITLEKAKECFGPCNICLRSMGMLNEKELYNNENGTISKQPIKNRNKKSKSKEKIYGFNINNDIDRNINDSNNNNIMYKKNLSSDKNGKIKYNHNNFHQQINENQYNIKYNNKFGKGIDDNRIRRYDDKQNNYNLTYYIILIKKLI